MLWGLRFPSGSVRYGLGVTGHRGIRESASRLLGSPSIKPQPPMFLNHACLGGPEMPPRAGKQASSQTTTHHHHRALPSQPGRPLLDLPKMHATQTSLNAGHSQ